MDLAERTPRTAVRRHPWEQARRRLVGAALRDVSACRRLELTTVLDIGSGDTWLARSVAADMGLRRVDAFDVAYTDHDCRSLRTETVRPSRTCPEREYDAVLLLDVIEHAADDASLLRLARERVRPDGFVVITVPAWPRLATSHDVALGHHRRYTPGRLRRVLREAGLGELRVGGAFASLLVVRALQRLLERLRGPRPLPSVGSWSGGPAVTRAASAALALDGRCGARLASAGIALPGLSLWAIAGPAR